MAKRREIKGQLGLFDNTNDLEGAVQEEPVILQERPRVSIKPGEFIPSSYDGYRRALLNWHKVNNIPLPNGFWDKNKRQLIGMYWGIYKRERKY